MDKHGWISVKERLPDEDMWILAYWGGNALAGCYSNPSIAKHKYNWQDEKGIAADPTHWQPLPEPPEVEK